MNKSEILKWLNGGDVSIRFQVSRDLLGRVDVPLRERIASEGWGAKLLSLRHPDGHWGRKFYQPKWTSSHYSILDLKNLGISPENKLIRESVLKILKEEKGPDQGINPSPNIQESDACLNGMVLNYACYFKMPEEDINSIVDFIISQRMPDGGFNCMYNRFGAVHSSLHTTLSILEGIAEYKMNGYSYRLEELLEAELTSREFVLMHQLFLSDRTGKIINKAFLRLPYPSRWKYDILKALDYFQYSGCEWDERMRPAINMILSKRGKDGRWKLNSPYPGQVHFHMEQPGKPSRWNTLRALRVLKHFRLK